jgi:dTDP-4-dehydrorhamnose 3,5-epimerase-like enzyme
VNGEWGNTDDTDGRIFTDAEDREANRGILWRVAEGTEDRLWRCNQIVRCAHYDKEKSLLFGNYRLLEMGGKQRNSVWVVEGNWRSFMELKSGVSRSSA